MLVRLLDDCLLHIHTRIYGDCGDAGQSGKVMKVGILVKPNEFYQGVFSADGSGQTLFRSIFEIF